MNKSKEKQQSNKFAKIFKSFLFWGIISLLVSALIDVSLLSSEKIKSYTIIEHIIKIITISLDSIGSGLIIGFFIDMVKESKEYTDFFDKRIQSTIIKKDFLTQLSENEKNKLFLNLIEPHNNFFLENKNAQKYIENKILFLENISNFTFRTHLTSETDVFIDKNKVCQKTTMRYRIYKTGGRFEPIVTCFDKDDAYIEKIEISCGEKKNKKYRKYTREQLTLTLSESHEAFLGKNEYVNICPVDEIFQNESSIIITKTSVEYGYNHWINFAWISLYPTYDISVSLSCQEGLSIKECIIFDDSNLFNCTQDNQRFSLTSDTWLDKYTGFSLTISKK